MTHFFANITWPQAVVYAVLVAVVATLIILGKTDYTAFLNILAIVLTTGVAADVTIKANNQSSQEVKAKVQQNTNTTQEIKDKVQEIADAGTSTPTPNQDSKA